MLYSLPNYVIQAVFLLNDAGHEAYVVGGAVRDMLLGDAPKDHDVTTSATPEEIHTVFKDFRTIDTGIAHGTVTVLIDKHPIEITTYRVDGGYTDARHPDSVRFTRSLKEDAARRDFTVNAMAYHPNGDIMDFFSGREDLSNHLMRAVGDPVRRFTEDALRILRGMRFAATLGFAIEKETALAMHTLKDRLSFVSPERIREEFSKLLCGKNAASVLREYADVVAVFLPEIQPMIGFAQRNSHHDFDVWEHTLHALSAAPADTALRYTLLFHDMGKPRTFFTDEAGTGHFYGHAQKSAEMADAVLRRLRFDNETRERITLLVKMHDLVPDPESKQFRRLRSKHGDRFLTDWLAAVRADRTGQHASLSSEADAILRKSEEAASRLLATEEPMDMKHLAIDGKALVALGMKPGKEMGRMLSEALEAVLSGAVHNEKTALIAWAKGKMPPTECERKFLVRKFDLAIWQKQEGYGESHITQTYLLSEPGVTARIRKRVYTDRTEYTHTEKRRLSALTAEEIEKSISAEEYAVLLQRADPERHSIEKIRYTLPFKEHLLELDVYPFWEKQAVLEIELSHEDEAFSLPPEITVLREVTAERAYKNAALAKTVPPEEP